MPLNASNFIRNRANAVQITSSRISHIVSYVIECYQLLIANNRLYSISRVNQNSTLSFEDYLKMDLVDAYLIPNKHLLTGKISALEEITFNYETQKRFIDISDKKEKPDKIDIYINKLGLKKEWITHDEHIYFAIECKRIKVLSDTQEYISDIQKFCDRNYQNLRIPFEGQIGFIESHNLTHQDVSDEVNRRLKSSTTITTKQFLQLTTLVSSFDGSYSSIHKKNHGRKQLFSTFHLLFDYSKMVIN